jgi:hypothetical protein
LDNWKWAKTIPETQVSFNEMVHIWTQTTQQTTTLDFARQVAMPMHHDILKQIVRKMPSWAKKHMQEHPRKYSSVPQLWVALKEEEASRMTLSYTGNIQSLTPIPHDRDTRTSILTMTEAILAEEAEHVDVAAPVALGYGDVSVPMSLGLHFLGPTTPHDGFGARTKSCVLSVVSVVVLGGDDIGCYASFRLDHHRGSGCHGATRLCTLSVFSFIELEVNTNLAVRWLSAKGSFNG